MEEEDANKLRKTHFVNPQCNAEFQANRRNRGNYCLNFLLKFFVIALFLSLLPLFPSDPPEFISHTVFAKSWELIHLLVIGIALSYGLFCRPKTLEIPTKTQISQPYASNILQHSSIFDYEEGNPSRISGQNAIPTQRFNLSYYSTEPSVDLRRENCKNFDEKPLGLPVRSLRSRVVDSDTEEGEEEEEESVSECESDLRGNNFSKNKIPRSERDEKLEEMGKSSPILCKSQSMRSDYFMAENGRVEAKQKKFQSFRSPAQEALSCQKFSGFCSWLPQSPNMVERESSWRENNFYMPFPNFTQVNDFNLVGLSPNSQNTNTNFFIPSAAVPTSVPFSTTEFASNSRFYNHENEHWSNPNFENVNLNVENPGFFMHTAAVPSPAVPSPLSVPASDFASTLPSRFRRCNNEAENWSNLPNLQNENFGGGNPNLFMPSAAISPSMPVNADVFASPIKASESVKFSHLKKKDEMRSDSNKNCERGSQERNKLFTPHSNDPLSGAKSPKVENGNSGVEKPKIFINTTEVLPSVPYPINEFPASIKASRSARFNQGASVKKDEERPEKDNVQSFGEGNSSHAPSFVDQFDVPTSKAGVLTPSPKKDEQRPIPERWDDDCFVIPSSVDNGIGNLVQEKSSPERNDSPQTPSSPGSSSRMSYHEQKSPLKNVEENVQWSAPTNNSELEDLVQENDSYKPSTPSPPPPVQTRSHVVESSSKAVDIRTLVDGDDQGSPPTPERTKALSRASHSRRFSCGYFFDRDPRKSFKDEAKEANRKTKGDQQLARSGKCGCLMLDVKPALNKAALRGKSVRTIRPKETSQSKNDLNEQKHEDYNEGERKGEKQKQEMVVIQIGISEKKSNSNSRKGEKLQGSGESSIVVGLSTKQSSNSTIVVPVPNDVEEENDSEIDKKADEFIAKFKEQIRLQKVTARGESSRQNQKSFYHT